jgi:hypothetical protein
MPNPTNMRIPPGWHHDVRLGLLIGTATLSLALPPPDGSSARSPVRPALATPQSHHLRAANFGTESASPEARYVANWVVHSGDSAGLPFAIVDKNDARLFVFSAAGMLYAATPVLIGSAIGDGSVPGIGARPIHGVLPEERTTPAGRFLAEPGRNTLGEDVVWVDYDNAVSMHRVRATDPQERRLERLDSNSAVDNRVSYGCINIPVAFYDAVIRPVFGVGRGVVYVLPEVEPLHANFPNAYAPPARRLKDILLL